MFNSNISLRDLIDILYRWSNEESMVLIRKSLTISRSTLLKIFKLLRECINKYFNVNPVKLGGDTVVCQVNESLFCHKQKYIWGCSFYMCHSGGVVFT